MTLWVLGLLVVFSLGVGRNVRAHLGFSSHLKKRVKNYYLARGGVEKGMALVVEDEELKSDNLTERWANSEADFRDIFLDGGYISLSYVLSGAEGKDLVLYGVEDESRRININKVSAGVIRSLLERVAGVDKEEAIDIAAAVRDWIDPDDVISTGGAEKEYYKKLDEPYECKNRELESIEELLLVKGMTPEILSKIRDVITVYTKGRININTTDSLVLYALGLNKDFASRIISFRRGSDGKDGTEDDVIFNSAGDIGKMGGLFTEESTQLNSLISKGLFSVVSDTFRINSTGRERSVDDSPKRTITCVIRRESGERPEILWWREK